jgi:hypothetical protein
MVLLRSIFLPSHQARRLFRQSLANSSLCKHSYPSSPTRFKRLANRGSDRSGSSVGFTLKKAIGFDRSIRLFQPHECLVFLVQPDVDIGEGHRRDIRSLLNLKQLVQHVVCFAVSPGSAVGQAEYAQRCGGAFRYRNCFFSRSGLGQSAR